MKNSYIEIIQNENDILLRFNAELGNATVTILDEDGGSVYECTTDITLGKSLTISTRQWTGTLYVIRITDSENILIKEISYYMLL